MTDPTCIFCKIVAGKIPSYKIYEDAHTLAFLDIAPFEKGHVLVVSKHHAAFLTDLPQPQLEALIVAVRNVASLLLAKLPCDGFNLLQNNGACATQAVPHVHFHVIPRWSGRTPNWSPAPSSDTSELATIQQRLTT